MNPLSKPKNKLPVFALAMSSGIAFIHFAVSLWMLIHLIIPKNGMLLFQKISAPSANSLLLPAGRKFGNLLLCLCLSAKSAVRYENGPVNHPDIDDVFDGFEEGRYQLRAEAYN